MTIIFLDFVGIKIEELGFMDIINSIIPYICPLICRGEFVAIRFGFGQQTNTEPNFKFVYVQFGFFYFNFSSMKTEIEPDQHFGSKKKKTRFGICKCRLIPKGEDQSGCGRVGSWFAMVQMAKSPCTSLKFGCFKRRRGGGEREKESLERQFFRDCERQVNLKTEIKCKS